MPERPLIVLVLCSQGTVTQGDGWLNVDTRRYGPMDGHAALVLEVLGGMSLRPGQTKMFGLPARADGAVSRLWQPAYPWATTYQSAMSHTWADGRLFIRGADALCCYDLRKH